MRFALLLAGALACAPLLAATPAFAHEYKLGAIVIGHPWARATPVKVGGAYMTLTNTGSAVDRLVKVASPIAERAEIHETKVEGGMAMMRPVPGIELKPGEKVELKPGGLHLMLMGLQRPLQPGLKLKLTLTFEKAGTIEVEAIVEKAGAPAAAPHDH